ncbi:hypothetical protein ACFQ1S_33720, partial [Kibdelosporangium lantanae]
MSTKLGDSLPHNTSRRFAVLLGAVALAGSLAAAPASAATGPDLRVDLSFDDHEYLPDEGVAVQVTITNVADWPNYANSVTTTFQNIAGSSMRVWSTSPCCAPTSLAPGQSTVVTRLVVPAAGSVAIERPVATIATRSGVTVTRAPTVERPVTTGCEVTIARTVTVRAVAATVVAVVEV